MHQYLQQGPRASLQPALALGRHAAAIGLETLDLARVHEAALAGLAPARNRNGIGRRARRFFAEAIAPIEKTHRAALQANTHLTALHKRLSQRTVDLGASGRHLKNGIVQRKAVEHALKRSAGHYAKLVKESRRLQQRLRRLTRQVLLAHEGKRAEISRELHDEVAQTLLGINVRLLTLKKQATTSTGGLQKEIASTQRLVEQSAKTMSRFARKFGRPHDS